MLTSPPTVLDKEPEAEGAGGRFPWSPGRTEAEELGRGGPVGRGEHPLRPLCMSVILLQTCTRLRTVALLIPPSSASRLPTVTTEKTEGEVQIRAMDGAAKEGSDMGKQVRPGTPHPSAE